MLDLSRAYASSKDEMRTTLFSAAMLTLTCIVFAIANSPSSTFPGA